MMEIIHLDIDYLAESEKDTHVLIMLDNMIPEENKEELKDMLTDYVMVNENEWDISGIEALTNEFLIHYEAKILSIYSFGNVDFAKNASIFEIEILPQD